MSCTDDDVRVIRVKNCLCNLVLTSERHLRASLETQTVYMDKTVGFIHRPLVALAEACKHKLWVSRRPVNASHCSVQVLGWRKRELFGKSVSLVISLFIARVDIVFNEEIFGELKLLPKSAFNQPRGLVKELLKPLFLNNLLRFILVQMSRFGSRVIFLRLALRAKF